jgi:hypothetical protein
MDSQVNPIKIEKRPKKDSFYVSIVERETGYFPALTVKSKNQNRYKKAPVYNFFSMLGLYRYM